MRTPGYGDVMSKAATNMFNPAQEQELRTDLLNNTNTALAYLRGQKYAADQQRKAMEAQNSAGNLIAGFAGDVFGGLAGGFGGSLGKAAGAKWFS